jgi:aryl-alcohol dehydrogenase-like predicted oxidoreductase
MLTGKIQSVDDLDATDFRRGNDRFLGANFARNLDLVKAVEKIAQRKGCTTAQLALAWVLAQAREIVTIPGTKRRDRLAENLGALAVTITFDEQAELEAAVPAGATHGLRYSEAMMNLVRR